jgi:arylsulfatase A-like enzyme
LPLRQWQVWKGGDLRFRRIEHREHTEEFLALREHSLAAVVEPQQNLIFVHLPIPHPDGIYNRSKRELTNDEANDYSDNLALADRTLGELRLAMEKAGIWDSSAVVVSSDHPLRLMWSGLYPSGAFGRDDNHKHPTIPFLWKTPGQREAMTYGPEFNTVLTQQLVLASLRGELANPGRVVAWLDAHRASVPVH